MKYDITIVGAGIIGLSVGMELVNRFKGMKILLLEKEETIAKHQTGRNSGVIHSGIYYKPGSLKAELAKKGNKQMKNFCEEHHVPYEACGKIIVATDESELPNLRSLFELGMENGLQVEEITKSGLKQEEPHLKGVAGIRVPSTAIIDYSDVSKAFAETIEMNGGTIMCNTELLDMEKTDASVKLDTSKGVFESRYVINCSGLHSDHVAKMSGIKTDMRIVPFRGEYYELTEEKRHLVKNLIYPVPNPDFPFLGVHFTRMIDGRVLIGPNAVLSMKREGYKKTSFRWKDFVDTLSFSGFWKVASGNMGEGLKEMYRSYNKNAFVKDVQRFIPEIKKENLVPAQAGVRAQALDSSGKLLDDFMIIKTDNAIHVCNAPSPAATASIDIGKSIVDYVKTNWAL